MLYIFRNGEQLGPYSRENIETFLKTGSLEYSDLVWEEGWSDWKPVAEVFPQRIQPPPPPTPASNPPVKQTPADSVTEKPTKSNRKSYVLYAVVLGILLYAASPYLATYQLINAVKSGNTESLKKRIDFPSLRESIKDQLNAHILRKAKEEMSNTKDDGMGALGAGLAAAIGPALVNGLVDNFVTPAGLAGLISNPNATASDQQPAKDIQIPKVSWAFFTSPTDFEVTITKGATLQLRFQEFGWKLYSVSLDPSEIDKESQPTASSANTGSHPQSTRDDTTQMQDSVEALTGSRPTKAELMSGVTVTNGTNIITFKIN